MNSIALVFSILAPAAAFFFLRNDKLWIFGNKKGFVDSTRYFMEYSVGVGAVRCIWLARNESELTQVRGLGYEAYLKNSFQGKLYSLFGGYQFICNGFGDINRFLALGSKVVNFWHGTPIKKIYLDADIDNQRFGSSSFAKSVARTLLKLLNSRIYRLYSSNSLERSLVSKAGGIADSRAFSLGNPRFDFIRQSTTTKISTLHNNDVEGVILFAPTWRETKSWHQNHRISEDAAIKLSNLLKSNRHILIVKPHPLTTKDEVDSWNLSTVENCYNAADFNIQDINEIYSQTSILITDVSSVIFDFMVLDRPVLFFMPDARDYLNGSRGIYDYYKDLLGENYAQTWEDLIWNIQASKFDTTTMNSPLMKSLKDEISNSTNVCERIYLHLTKRSC